MRLEVTIDVDDELLLEQPRELQRIVERLSTMLDDPRPGSGTVYDGQGKQVGQWFIWSPPA